MRCAAIGADAGPLASVLIPNVVQRQFTVTRRDKARVTDISYIWTWQGWLYLAVDMESTLAQGHRLGDASAGPITLSRA